MTSSISDEKSVNLEQEKYIANSEEQRNGKICNSVLNYELFCLFLHLSYLYLTDFFAAESSIGSVVARIFV